MRPRRNTEVYQPKEDAWTAGPLLQQGYSFATGAILEGSNEAFVVGASEPDSLREPATHSGIPCNLLRGELDIAVIGRACEPATPRATA